MIVSENKKTYYHAQVLSKAAVFIKPHGKKPPRSGKGWVLRRATYAVFNSEIETIHESLEKNDNTISSLPSS